MPEAQKLLELLDGRMRSPGGVVDLLAERRLIGGWCGREWTSTDFRSRSQERTCVNPRLAIRAQDYPELLDASPALGLRARFPRPRGRPPSRSTPGRRRPRNPLRRSRDHSAEETLASAAGACSVSPFGEEPPQATRTEPSRMAARIVRKSRLMMPRSYTTEAPDWP